MPLECAEPGKASKEVARMCHSSTTNANVARIVDHGNRLQGIIESAGDMLRRDVSAFIGNIAWRRAAGGRMVKT